jgi:hypothetical protein
VVAPNTRIRAVLEDTGFGRIAVLDDSPHDARVALLGATNRTSKGTEWSSLIRTNLRRPQRGGEQT